MNVQHPSSAPSAGAAESDIDITAELPVLDVTAYEAVAEARTGGTDTWIMPAPVVSQPPVQPASTIPNAGVGDDGQTEHVPADAEQRIQQLTSELAQTRAATGAAEERISELQRLLDEREAANGSWGAREKQLEEKLALRERALALVQEDLTAAQAAAATYLESLRSLEGRRGIFEHLYSSLRWEIEARDTRLTRAEEQVGLVTSRSEDLEATLVQRAARIVELEAALRAAQSRCEELEAASTKQSKRADEQQEFVKVLQADANANAARVKELEGDLRAAEDMIHRLEAELRIRNSRLDELEKKNQYWRTTVEEARNALVDRDSLIRRLEEETTNSLMLPAAVQQQLEATGTHEDFPDVPVPDGNTRLLIRADGASEVVHVLGRKTTVGRTSDNDLQIDAKYVSRHHAVILAGPAHTIIEDLNSTNGVLVNGRRITREALRNGDSVLIGKAVFRFAVRS